MFDAVVVAAISAAAGNIAAYLLQGRADAIRDRVSAIFQHGTKRQRKDAMRALDRDAAALKRNEVTQADVTARWSSNLTALLMTSPNAREDVEALAQNTQPRAKSVNIGSQHNHGSGTFIGGDHHGDIKVNGGGD